MCAGVGHWVDYGCPHNGAACEKRSARVDEVHRVPCCTIRADLGGIICVSLHMYGGVWFLVGLTVVEMGGVFKVEVKCYGLGVSAE